MKEFCLILMKSFVMTFLLIGSFYSYANMQFTRLTVNDGLSQHDVSCVIQDSYGFIWIGTYDGLNRFDGYKVENFFSNTDDPRSLPSNRILCLFEDSKKRLWIGTDGEGICYFDLIHERFHRLVTSNDYKEIKAITELPNGEIIVGTSNGVLKISENDQGLNSEILQLPLTGMLINEIILVDSTLYFGTINGIWRMAGSTCELVTETEGNYILAMTLDHKNRIWFGALGYLAFVNNTDPFEVKEIKVNDGLDIRSLCVSEDNDIWFGTLDNGLFSVSDSSLTVSDHLIANYKTKRGLLSNTVLSLYCDETNTIWAGNRKGLCYASLSGQKFNQVPINTNEPFHMQISTLLYDKQKIYFGIQNGGAFFYDTKTNETKDLKLPKGINPKLFFKHKDEIFLGTNLGLYKFLKNTNQLIFEPLHRSGSLAFNPNIFSVCEDLNKTLYIGTFSGLIVKSNEETSWIHDALNQAEVLRRKRIFTLLYDNSENCIWIGTISEGLFKLNLSDNENLVTIEKYNSSMNTAYHIHNNTIWCFLKDRNGNIWVGTDSGMLFKQSNSNVFKSVDATGVNNKKIMAIIEDENGNLWLSNSQGIIYYSPKFEIVEEYSYNDGLSTSSFTEAVGKDEDGNLYFGSVQGINFFDPNEITQSKRKNKVFITDFKVHHNTVKPNEEYFDSQVLDVNINETTKIELNHKQNNFLFEFAGTNIVNAIENEFRYKLEGYDDKWVYTTGKQRFATYSNLPPDNYTFLLDASNHDGIWSNSPRQIQFTIKPVPWRTTWAYSLYALLFLILSGVFIYFLRNRQILKQQLLLDKLNREKEHEIHEHKLMFFTDVAHEFKTPLSLIVGPLNDLMNNQNTKEVSDFCFQVISRNTKRMIFLVNQLLDFRKVSANVSILNVIESNLTVFIHKTVEAFQWQAQNENINLNILAPESFVCFFDKNVLEKVLYNLISNAFKYTPENGIIELELKPIWKDNIQFANIIIRDSGMGIPDHEKTKVFERFFHGKHRYSSGIGLHLSYTLVKAHKGDLNVADSNYGGAEFIMSIPVSLESYSGDEITTEERKQEYLKNNLVFDQKKNKNVTEELDRVLVVEDDHDMRAYLINCLQRSYKVLSAVNGKEGFEIAMKNIPDIILSDVMMPEMDGLEMCKKIKSNIETSHIPLLMLTAKDDETYQKRGLDSGAWDYIAKPFNTDTLLKKVDNIIQTRNKYKAHILNQNITLEVSNHYTPFDQRFMSRINELIKENIGNPSFSVEDLSHEIGFSRMQLHRKLKAMVGESATGYINKIKINFAKGMFDDGCDRVQEAMDAIGVNSYSHFNNTFKKFIGQSPSQYINQKKSSVS